MELFFKFDTINQNLSFNSVFAWILIFWLIETTLIVWLLMQINCLHSK